MPHQKTPPSMVMIMHVDASGNIRFDPRDAPFKTDQSPQILRIDTSQLHKMHPASSIVELKIDALNLKHIRAAFVEDGASPPRSFPVAFNTRLTIGRIDSILILFRMRTDYPHNTGPFPIKFRIARSWVAMQSEGAAALSEEDYDPQVGNEPPVGGGELLTAAGTG